MSKIWVRFLALLITLGALIAAACMPAPEANALPCEHRSAKHVAEHGGTAEDSRYHVSRGELPTCGEQEQSQASENKRDRDDDGKRWRRDEWGFHCTWRGCG